MDANRAEISGINAFIRKPVATGELAQTMWRVLDTQGA